jgi:hypothetical protein
LVYLAFFSLSITNVIGKKKKGRKEEKGKKKGTGTFIPWELTRRSVISPGRTCLCLFLVLEDQAGRGHPDELP